MTTPKVVEPPVLVAVTVQVEEEEIAVGVPEILPVAVLKDNPFGKAGVML